MRIEPGRQDMKPDEIRAWTDRLGLSATEAGELLNLQDPNGAFRKMLAGKPIGGPTIQLMESLKELKPRTFLCRRSTGSPTQSPKS